MMKVKRRFQEIKNIVDNFGIIVASQCLVRRIISFSNYERYVFDYLDNFFAPVVEQFKKEYNPEAVVESRFSNKVWTLWWQGEDVAPELVKVCIKSQRRAFASIGTEVIVLTKDNWEQFIKLPQYIIEKVKNGKITITHFSDIIRAELLKCHGGLWIDATVFCTKPVGQEVVGRGLYTVRYNEQNKYLTRMRWTGFLFGDTAHSELFCFMAEAFKYYWKEKNALIAYLLIDYVIAIAFKNLPRVRQSIESISVSNVNLWKMLNNLNKEYNDLEWSMIIENTTFLKLSYKKEFNGGELKRVRKNGQKTYWGMISDIK